MVISQGDRNLVELAKQFGLYETPPPTQATTGFYRNVEIGRKLQQRLEAVGGAKNIEELLEKENPKTVPESATIGFESITENSVLMFWNPHSDGGSPITGYNIVIKNEDTDQTITELNTSYNVTNQFFQNLDSGTNYKGYVTVINAVGNSFQQSYGFKTLGTIPIVTPPVIIPPVVTPPIVTPPTITISAEVQTILTKFDNNNYEYPYTDLPALINSVRNGTLSNENFLITINQLLDQKTIIDKTIVIPPIVEPPVEKEYDVTVLRINEFGGVYSELFYGIKGNKLLELESQFLVVLSDKPKPTDQEVRDYYNFVDTSINENMVSQSIGAFTLKDGKVTGKIIYIAESSFNSYYYNKPVTSIVQIKDQAGSTIKLKTNNLNFTETQRDETITINEGVGDLNAVKIEFYVWKGINEPVAFALEKVYEIVAQEIGLNPCPIGQHRNFNGKCVPDDPIVKSSLLGKVMGVTALLGTLALLGSKRR